MDRVQIAVLIALPRKRQSRKYLKRSKGGDEYMGDTEKEIEDPDTKKQDDKGSQEGEKSGHDSDASEFDDLEMSIGTIILPFAGEG